MFEPQKPIIYRPAKAKAQNSAYPPAINSTLILLQSLKLPAWSQATPLHRFFWRRGVLLSPPILAGFISNLCGYGIFFALLTALALSLFSGWSPWAMGCGRPSEWCVLARLARIWVELVLCSGALRMRTLPFCRASPSHACNSRGVLLRLSPWRMATAM